MTFRQRKKEITQSAEAKLTQLLHEMNTEIRTDTGSLICETECTMARIRSYSDFLYILRVKPLQTACYYGAAFFFLLMCSAIWCARWDLTAIFGVIFLILATLPHNMRVFYFNKQADSLEEYYGKVINAEFTDEGMILNITRAPESTQELDENGDAVARRSALRGTEDEVTHIEVPYSRIAQAVECTHSFYIFPVDENRRAQETVICDKTQFLCGTPMQLRDALARGCGKRFKIKTKKG